MAHWCQVLLSTLLTFWQLYFSLGHAYLCCVLCRFSTSYLSLVGYDVCYCYLHSQIISSCFLLLMCLLSGSGLCRMWWSYLRLSMNSFLSIEFGRVYTYTNKIYFVWISKPSVIISYLLIFWNFGICHLKMNPNNSLQFK